MGKISQLANKRDSLQNLQPSGLVGSTDLVGKNGVFPAKGVKQSGKSKKLVDSTQKTLVFQDSKLNLNSSKSEKATENKRRPAQSVDKKSTENEANELMGQTSITETYWKDYSEQQCQALAETLEENKALHEENDQLKTKINELTIENNLLKLENESLSELASKAEEFADLVQSAMGETENTEERQESGDDTSTDDETQS